MIENIFFISSKQGMFFSVSILGNYGNKKKREKRAKSFFAYVENLIQQNLAYGNTSRKINVTLLMKRLTILLVKICRKKN